MNCQFTLLRYVPDIVKGEFLNLGVILLDEAGHFLDARMAGDEELRRLHFLHPAADMDLMRELQAGFPRQVARLPIDKLRDTLSTALTMAEPKLCITEDRRAELESLYRRYVAAPPRAAREAENPRQRLRRRLHQRLRREGLLERLQPAPAAPFTFEGDPFKIDYAYAPATNGRRKYIHCVTLDRATHQAKVLAFTFEHIRRIRHSDQLTAVTDEGAHERARLTRGLLEASGVRVTPLSELDSLVREIRSDLALV